MLKAIFRLIFKYNGWKLYLPTPAEAYNSIVVAAPHTSNWDFVYAITALQQLGVNPRFTIKKEFNKFPIGWLISDMGALWIDRKPKEGQKKKKSMTQVMVDLFAEADRPLTMVVTPEGTRSPSKQWRTGFYYAALEAKVPICLAFMDYRTKTTGIAQCFMPSGDINSDMKIIMNFYRDKMGKFPENFCLDERYA